VANLQKIPDVDKWAIPGEIVQMMEKDAVSVMI
jgi:hypothetical protein